MNSATVGNRLIWHPMFSGFATDVKPVQRAAAGIGWEVRAFFAGTSCADDFATLLKPAMQLQYIKVNQED